MADLDMPLVRHVTDVEYVRHMREVLRTDIYFESDVVDLSDFCLPRPFRLFSLKREVETSWRGLFLKVRQRSKSLLVDWHIIELFVIPPERCGIVYAATPAFWLVFPFASCGYVVVFFLPLWAIG